MFLSHKDTTLKTLARGSATSFWHIMIIAYLTKGTLNVFFARTTTLTLVHVDETLTVLLKLMIRTQKVTAVTKVTIPDIDKGPDLKHHWLTNTTDLTLNMISTWVVKTISYQQQFFSEIPSPWTSGWGYFCWWILWHVNFLSSSWCSFKPAIN